MGLLAVNADTNWPVLFILPLQPRPSAYLSPCSPGHPRTSRSMPLFPAPSSGAAEAGEALPTAPPVTSAPGRIPTLGLSRERTGRKCAAPAAALGGASSKWGEEGPQGGWGGGGRGGQRLGHSARC